MFSNTQYNVENNIAFSFEEFYLSEEMADLHFIFETNDGQCERIPAHKLLLVNTSDVFRTMLNGRWQEKNEVKIVDASAAEFKEFLQFIYLPRVKITTDHVTKFMYLGQKYNLINCLSVCEQFIMNSVETGNVCWAYELGIFLEAATLKKFCEIFIEINTKAVFESDDFLECDASVMSHILKLNTLSCSEEELFEACLNWAKRTVSGEQPLFFQPLSQDIMQIDQEKMFNDPRFKWMTQQEQALLIPAHANLLICKEFNTIWQLVSERRGKSFEFVPWAKKPAMDCDRLIIAKSYLDSPYFIKNIETTTFSINKPLFLTVLICSDLAEHSGYYYIADDLPSELTISQIPDTNQSGDELVLRKLRFTIDGREDRTTIKLRKPILVKPGFRYQIRLEQSLPSDETFCSGEFLKSEVEMKSNIVVNFHGCSPVIASRRPPNKKLTRGLIKGFQFIDIYS